MTAEKNIFVKGNRITTNNLNCFEIIAVNTCQICCIDVLANEFVLFYKTDHNFELFDIKHSLITSLKKILDETRIDEEHRYYIYERMHILISALLNSSKDNN